MSEIVIETKQLTKQYGTQKSVAKLNIHVRQGRIYGLLGRNGAGKTTTMKMLLGLTPPTSGEVTIWGKPLSGNEKKLLPRIGSLIESPGFYPNLTGTENLRIFAALRGLKNQNAIQSALELVGLPYRDKKLFSQYSLGMKQRLAIALAVMHDPELLILDEPINGLDPIGIAEVRQDHSDLQPYSIRSGAAGGRHRHHRPRRAIGGGELYGPGGQEQQVCPFHGFRHQSGGGDFTGRFSRNSVQYAGRPSSADGFCQGSRGKNCFRLCAAWPGCVGGRDCGGKFGGLLQACDWG